MKKVSILIVTIFVSLACFARGGFGVEINVIPPKTGIDNPISFTDGLKLRGFLSKSFAVRGGFGQQKASYKETREGSDNWMVEITGSDDNGKRSNTSIKSGVFVGMDYYITNHLYIGTELGFRYNSIKEKEIITKITGIYENPIESINKEYLKIEGFSCVPSLRLGWTF